jgi:hypothetical protein
LPPEQPSVERTSWIHPTAAAYPRAGWLMEALQ